MLLNLSQSLSHFQSIVDILNWRGFLQKDKTVYRFIEYSEDDQSTEKAISYEALEKKARSRAAVLQQHKVRKERIILLYPPDLDFIVSFFGCLFAGAIAVPSNPPISATFISRIQYIIKNSRAKFIMCPVFIRDFLISNANEIPEFKNIQWITTDVDEDDVSNTFRDIRIKADAIAFLQYTSGSTSEPKGVKVSHGNILANERIIQEAFGHTHDSIGVGWLPLYHDMGLIGNALQTVYAGGESVLFSPLAFIKKPLLWLQLISKYRANTSGGPNFAYEHCINKIKDEQKRELDLSSWEVAFNGAEPIRLETMDRFADAFSVCGFRKEAFYPCYGMAESTLIISGGHKLALPQRAYLEGNSTRGVIGKTDSVPDKVSCGFARFGQKVIIVDPKALTPSPDGHVGEIWTSGPSVAQGYWNRPKETKNTFRAYLADGNGPFLRTGDLGFVDNGELYVTGRLKDLIIIRGQNYYPQDIELSVESSHSALKRGGGASFSIEIDGEERLVIAQEVIRHFSQEMNPQKIIKSICSNVSEKHGLNVYAVLLLKTYSIPKTSSGKIQRYACKNDFLSGNLEIIAEWRQDITDKVMAFDLSFAEGAQNKHGQSLHVFIIDYLKKIIAKKLGLKSGESIENEPLNTLGMDSLLVMALISQIQTEIGLKVSFKEIMEGLTLFDLSVSVQSHWEKNLKTSSAPLRISKPKHVIEPLSSKGRFDINRCPLSEGQKSLWIFHQIVPENPEYNIGFTARISSKIDLPGLRRAFQVLVARHPALRTRYVVCNIEPMQEISDDEAISFEIIDASKWNNDHLKQQVLASHRRPFDLKTGPVFRVVLFTTSEENHILQMTFHHIAVDGWSLWLILDELRYLYLAERQGEAALLPQVACTYIDHVENEIEFFLSSELERCEKYWSNQLRGLSVLDLPTDHHRPSMQTFNGASHAFTLDQELSERIKDLSRIQGVTLFIFLMTVFQTMLHRYTSQEDIVVGTAFTGRDNPDFNGVVGYFINMLAIRTDFATNPSFTDLLLQVRRTVLDAIDHKEYPYSHLTDLLKVKRDPGRPPICQVSFVLQVLQQSKEAANLLTGQGSWNWGDLLLEPYTIPQQEGLFDLSLEMIDSGTLISGFFKYNADLFDAPRIERMADHFKNLIKEIVRHPEARISQFSLLSKAERHQLSVEWNATEAPYPKDKCIHELFEKQVMDHPDAIAAVQDVTELSYGELNTQANKLAHYLRRLGVKPDTRVAICVERSPEMVIGLLSILKAGGAYVPIDPSYPTERISYMLQDCAPAVVLTHSQVNEYVRTSLSSGVRTIIDLEKDALHWEDLPETNPDLSDMGLTPDHLAYVIYTSGSTGKPKGVMVEHRGVVNLAISLIKGFCAEPDSRILQVASFSFDACVSEIFITLCSGATLFLPAERKA